MKPKTLRLEEPTSTRFLNERRLRDYPRLMLLAMVAVILANILLRQGWVGGLGQVIGSDFITLYAAGWQYRHDPAGLYDFERQYAVQQALVEPTVLPGLNPFISPPYVAMAYAGVTGVPLVRAFLAWTGFSLVAVWGTVALLARYLVPASLRRAGLTSCQLGVLIVSSFPFVAGILVGQNHAITIILMTGSCAAMVCDRKLLAGLLAGLTVYKPQLAFGLLLVWVCWREFKPLLGYALSALVWVGASLLTGGFRATIDYIALTGHLLRLPYVDGFPASAMVTPYGLLATLAPESFLGWIQGASRVILILATAALAVVAWRRRCASEGSRAAVMGLALLYPFVTTPYALLHDLVLLVPVLVLFARGSDHARGLRYLVAASYVGALVLTFLASVTGIALTALIPLAVFCIQLLRVWQARAEPVHALA